jgi:hypothetical protein
LESLKASKEFLLLAAEKLPRLRQGYDNNEKRKLEYLAVLDKTVTRLKSELNAVIQSLNELEETAPAVTAQRLNAAIGKFKFLEQSDTAYTKLCGALSIFAESLPDGSRLPDDNNDSGINAAALGRLMNRVKMGYFPTDEAHVEKIKSALTFPQTGVNILDPCCGCGTALKILTDGENVKTYGTEIDGYRARQAEKKIQRVGYGSFYRSRISNRSFHCIFLNPPYLSVMKEGGGSRRAECSFLIDSLRYLMLGGVLIYIIPFYRLTEDICRVLAENFDEIEVYRFEDSEFKKYKQIAVFGRLKQRDSNIGERADELLRLSLNPDTITPITELPANIYPLPNKEIEVKLFKGAEFNVNELALQLEKSKSLNSLFEKSKIDSLHRNPLLPLKVAQIGLIGGSGLMNGLIECDEPHIIKGKKKKKCVTTTSTEKKEGIKGDTQVTETREVTSNKMVFNVLTADGFKQLA